MGADNFISFHTWKNYELIIENFPIAIIARPPYTEKALEGFSALTYPHLRLNSPKDFQVQKSGWFMMNNPLLNISSTHQLERIRAGDTNFTGAFQSIVSYILANGLYGTNHKDTKNPPTSQSPKSKL